MSVKNKMIYPYDSKPFGLVFDEWSTRWWQWILKIPKSINPTGDHTGQYASVGQVDQNVFFLCQTVEGVGEQPLRKINIPRGRCIFMPILNWISSFGKDGKSDYDLIETARTRIDAIGQMDVKLDGINIEGLERYRFQTDFFVVDLPEENILNLPAGKSRFVSDGYWLFTRPILNKTMISTLGSCSSGKTKIGVNYSIVVI